MIEAFIRKHPYREGDCLSLALELLRTAWARRNRYTTRYWLLAGLVLAHDLLVNLRNRALKRTGLWVWQP